MHMRIPALLVAVGAIAALGCGDPTAIKARFSNRDISLTLYALNGSPASLPSAVSVRDASRRIVDANFAFDLAFDLRPDSLIHVYSVGTVASELLPVRRVGLLTTTQAFGAVTEAPTSGFTYDTSLVVPVGRTILVDVIENSCGFESFLGLNIRAKLVVDSVDVPKRAIYVHMLVNPNCGFKQLTPGEPKK